MGEEIEAISEEDVSVRLGGGMWCYKIPKQNKAHENSSNATTTAGGCLQRKFRKSRQSRQINCGVKSASLNFQSSNLVYLTVYVCKTDFHNVLSDKKQPGKTWACQLYSIKWLNKIDIIGFYIHFPTDFPLKFVLLVNWRKKMLLFPPPPQ